MEPATLILGVVPFVLMRDVPLWELQDADWSAVSSLLKVSGSKTSILLSLISTTLKEDIWPSVKALRPAESFSAVSSKVICPWPTWGAEPIVGIINASETFTSIAVLSAQ